jgi:Dolichyl-phosphate-mannose-protein mannosyltransferase
MIKTIKRFVLKENNRLSIIFIISLSIRLIYCFATPFLKVKLDEQRYDILSNQILDGNYDLDAVSFICAPLLPCFLALIKLVAGQYWQPIFYISQAVFTAISVVYLFKLTDLLFKNTQISTIAAWFYCFYPMTFYYVKNVGQESFFQSFLIISVCFLIRFSKFKRTKDLVVSATLFSACFLTKGFILFWSPFIVFFIFRIKGLNLKDKISNSLIFSGLCLLFTMPIGIYNLQKHNVYTFSGDGMSAYFWFGNSEYAYHRDVLGKVYDINETADNQDTAKLIYDMSPPNVSEETYRKAFVLFPAEQARQTVFRRNAWSWIQQSPARSMELKMHSFTRFFLWGLNFKIYPLSIWLLSLIIFTPLYMLAYSGMFVSIKSDFEKHNWIASLCGAMLVFSLVFAFESRFRTITLEPFYIVYAAFSAYKIQNKVKKNAH